LARRYLRVSAYPFVARLLTEKYDVDPEVISPEATWEGLGLDSLSVVELIFDVEDELGIEIVAESQIFQTLGESVALVDELLQAKED
jgi:acyl carrier protein